jgi:GntR family transcriptional repressor for pyruvate dehydrogenase complex
MPTTFTAVRRQPLSESVYRQLEERILRGELAPGAELPAERALSVQLGVNRGAVREAIKRLQQAGLVAVRHGGNHAVRDYLQDGGLELLPSLLLNAQGRLNAPVVGSIMALRASLAPEIAAAAARKPDAALADELDAAVARLRGQRADLKALQHGVLEFWGALAARGGSLAFRLAFNSTSRAWAQAGNALSGVLAAEFRDLDGLAAIAAAVRAGDAARAREAGRAHVEIGRRAVERALDAVGVKDA